MTLFIAEQLERIFKAEQRTKEEAEGLAKIAPNQRYDGARHLHPVATDMLAMIHCLLSLIKRQNEALSFYGNEKHYYEEIKDHLFRTTQIREDGGSQAREAIREAVPVIEAMGKEFL